MKYFLITIDAEGDNLWHWKEGMPLGTENALFLPRFQELCNKYKFIPTWLTNWEMANDDYFVKFALNHLAKGECEIGMHLHVWNTPPYYELPKHEKSGLPYLIEYPEEIMREKIQSMTNLLEEKFGKRPVTHRAGRWAMDDRYFRLLHEFGYLSDASITPYVDWKTSVGQTLGFDGPNYYLEKPQISYRNEIMEIPVTTLWSEEKERTLWLRPNRVNLDDMLYVIEENRKSECDYLMFMLHSSELMPGGSPTFMYEGGIERLYEHLNKIFDVISKDYEGIGLEAYTKIKQAKRGKDELLL